MQCYFYLFLKLRRLIFKIKISGDPNPVDIHVDNIMTYNVVIPEHGSNYHKVNAVVIGNEYGALFMIWASNEQDAFDEAVDQGMMESFLVVNPTKEDMDNDEYAALGNAGELHDISHCWVREILPFRQQSWEWQVAMIRAESQGVGKLNELVDYR